jgi:DNA polymerase III alpha subunit (gram-positive type)
VAWWGTYPEAWAECRRDLRDPAEAMPAFVRWVKGPPGRPVFVAYSAGFDFLFMYWYMIRFAGESPFSISALDVKTFAMAVMGCEYRNATKKNMPKRWFTNRPHTHKALDDALGQGELFCSMLAESRKGRR